MSRNLDPTLAASLSAGVIQPVLFVQITFNSGTEYVWSGIGDFDFNGHTFSGVGNLGSIGPIGEGSAVKADGTSVTLSGIGLSQIGIPAPPVTPPDPPLPPAPGESVAWSFATLGAHPSSSFSFRPSIFNGGLGCSGEGSSTLYNGNLSIINGDSFCPVIHIQWGGFRLPPEIPRGAKITHIYPVVNWTANPGGFQEVSASPGGVITGGFGTDIAPNVNPVITAQMQNTVSGIANLAMFIDFVGVAIYYIGEPQSATSLIYEALNDVRMGAPAKIWYGQMANGALIGTPYLEFSGTVDKPTVQVDEKSASITLALENRLVNLQRANQRRYTAADQKLAFPTDMAFNWVESLNDIALRWGN